MEELKKPTHNLFLFFILFYIILELSSLINILPHIFPFNPTPFSQFSFFLFSVMLTLGMIVVSVEFMLILKYRPWMGEVET